MTSALQQPLRSASEDQAAASDPLQSVWVGASAGTGKTKVLIDRVLRLMLPRSGMDAKSATKPEKVLCLTFTKTGAAEMSNRIYKRLAGWAVMDDARLAEDLEQLIGLAPNAGVMEEARRLFARVLDTPGGLKIMTIHSFCQSVLKRFPIEAGLPPHFQLMDEQSAVEYMERCLHDIIAAARQNPESTVAQAFSLLALHLDSTAMSDLMSKIMSKRSQLALILENHGDAEGFADNTANAVYRALGLNPGDNEHDVLRASADVHPEDEKNLKSALRALLQGSVTDQKKASALQPWLEMKEKRIPLYGQYRSAFFTAEGTVLKTLATKAAQGFYADIVPVMQREAERLLEIDAKLQAVRLARLNAALLSVAADMVGRYMRHKRQTDKLDFEDLIIKTCELLAEKGMVNWVLFKLDEGIDHILVDEAQDTSPSQWQVIRALAEEFFAGRGSRDDVRRTLFVVGDEKQSIFSFQGADPAAFADMQAHFREKVAHVQEGWEIFLQYSFRSTRTVLDVVDSVFAPDAVRKGVVVDLAREVRHLASREKHAGLVELWPLIKTESRVAPEAWKLPVAVEGGDNSASRLAHKIAGTIKGWLDTKEMLPSKGRPIRAGDVLILVQSRGAFVEQLMRALKEEDVPVAGIDRMTLTEEIAVMDLLALASFALLPRDDLALASILKSPLIGLSEEELYDLCRDRKASLWESVQDKTPQIGEYLRAQVKKAGRATPYEFFANILNTACHVDARSGRRAFYARLGFDIQDALDEFLNSCLHYEQSHTPSLQKFTDWFMRGEAEIKREQDQHGADQVRIMTVHGSKGLQAPIVFLPDTVKKMHDHNQGRVRLIWPPDHGGGLDVPLWSPRAEFSAPIYAELQAAALEKQEEEYRRLLYVALTRAEDRLYICGYHGVKLPKADCWYSLVRQSFPAGADKTAFTLNGAAAADEEGTPLLLARVSHPQIAPPVIEKHIHKPGDDIREPLPAWALSPPEEEASPPVPLTPSKPDEEEPPVKGPMTKDAGARFRRGNIMHHILETLPQLPVASRDKALAGYLARPALQLPKDVQKSFAAEIMAVLNHPEFAPIFGPGSRAEVPVVGLAGIASTKLPRILSGQIDRLLVTEAKVMVVDYKTNRPPPETEEGVAVIYLKQMAAYKSVLAKIYPNHEILCALLWTDKPLLMPLSDKLLDRYRL